MQNGDKWLKLAIYLNLVLFLAFIVFDYATLAIYFTNVDWGNVNPPITSLSITFSYYVFGRILYFTTNDLSTSLRFVMPNLPLIIFGVAVTLNLFLIWKAEQENR